MRLVSLVFGGFFAFSSALADEKTDLIAKLQLVMQRHVDQSLIDGAIHRRDFETGEVVKYFPIDTHSMVMALDEDYVLCLDLTTESGSSVPVDFYITETVSGFRVYQAEINNREVLESLMKTGRVERVR